MTTGPLRTAGRTLNENPVSGLMSMAEYFPAFAVCTLLTMNVRFVSPGNSTSLKRHWQINGGGSVVESVNTTVSPTSTCTAAGVMLASGSTIVRNCFAETLCNSTSLKRHWQINGGGSVDLPMAFQ